MADVQTTLLTGDDLLEIVGENPDQRYELIEGELIEMALHGIEHGYLSANVAFLIHRYIGEKIPGHGLLGGTGFYTRGNPYTVRAADFAFVTYMRLPRHELPSGYGTVAPELVIEIVSPTDRAGDIEQKAQEWLDFGVDLVWVVYPKTRRVHVYTRGNPTVILHEHETLTGGDVLPGFSAPVRAIFAD